MKKRIGIIGSGNVGSALLKGAQNAGYEAKAAGHDPSSVRDAGQFGEILILAVPYPAIDDAIRTLGGAVKGKTLIDVTNALTADFQLAIGFSTSGAEELQKKAPDARVVKAFNTVFAGHMSTGKVKGDTLTAFAAGDHAASKNDVLELAREIGFDAIDCGPLKNARWLETLGYLNIQLGYMMKMGPETGFKYLH